MKTSMYFQRPSSLLILVLFLLLVSSLSFNLPRVQYRKQLTARVSSLSMAQRGGGPKSGGAGGGTALDSRVKQEVKSTLKDEIERDYRLILHDDTVHTIQQVCEILGKVKSESK